MVLLSCKRSRILTVAVVVVAICILVEVIIVFVKVVCVVVGHCDKSKHAYIALKLYNIVIVTVFGEKKTIKLNN